MSRYFELPDDFHPNCQQEYFESGVKFEIWTQNKGLQLEEAGRAPHLLWIFAIWAKGRIIEAGPFRWDPSDRQLSDLAVCNNLATFYLHSDSLTIKKAVVMAQPVDMDEVVLKCAHHMLSELLMSPKLMDYDIITSESDEWGWQVVLNSPVTPERMFEYKRKAGDPMVTVTTYVKAHVHHTAL
jgi:hypothetical protein